MPRPQTVEYLTLIVATITGVCLESLDPGASIGLCLIYTVLLFAIKWAEEKGALITAHTQRGLKLDQTVLKALFLTMPITMLHQRSLVATTALFIGLGLWLYQHSKMHRERAVNIRNKSNIKDEYQVNAAKEKFRWLEANRMIPLAFLFALTLWAFFVETLILTNPISHNHEGLQRPLNLLGTFMITVVWCALCSKIKSAWSMVIPILLGASISLIILISTGTIDPVKARDLPRELILFDCMGLTPMLSHKNNIATVGTITLSILCYCLCRNRGSDPCIQRCPCKLEAKNRMIWFFFWLNLLVLALTPSRLGLFSAIILISLLLVNWIWASCGQINKKWLLTASIILLACTTISTIELTRSYLFHREPADKGELYDSSTGRLKIWEIAMSLQPLHSDKLIGMGSNHWEKNGTPKMIEYNNFPAESTHNGFIEVFLAYGAIGLTLLMGAILTSVIRPSVTSHLKVQKPIARIIPQGILLLGVLLPLLVESYSWAWIGSPTLSIWMGFCLTQNTKSNQKQPETTRTF